MSMRQHKNIPNLILPAWWKINRISFFIDGFIYKLIDYWLWNSLWLSHHFLLQKYFLPIHFSCNLRLKLWFFIGTIRLIITFTSNRLIILYCFSWTKSWTWSLRDFFTLCQITTSIAFLCGLLWWVRKLFWLLILFMNYIWTMIRFWGLMSFIFTQSTFEK